MKAKILLFSLQKFGGGSIDALGLSNGLCHNRFFHYLIISKDNELVDKFTDNEFRKVFKIKTFKSSFFDFIIQTFVLLRFLNLIKIVNKLKPDIIFITHFHPWSAFIFILRIFLKNKIFYGVHDNPFDPKEKGPLLMIFLEKIFLKYSDIVITYSNFINEDIKKYLPKKKIETIYLGIHKDLFPDFKKNFDLNKEFLTILFFGRILPYKGIDTLIEAVEILREEKIKVETIIAGRGEIDEKYLDKIKELKINLKNYWISNEELLSLLKKTDILIIPYKKGTQSGLISIGLAYGIPIIATNVGSFNEYIKDGFNGFLIEPDNPKELSEKIKEIYFNREILLKMSNNTVKIKEKFLWENTVKELIKLIENEKFGYKNRCIR